MYNKFVMEKGLNHLHISINDKKYQDIAPKGYIN